MALLPFRALIFICVFILSSCAHKQELKTIEEEQADLSCSYFYFLWGTHAEFNHHLPEALEAYEKALICDPDASYVQEKLPVLLLKLGKFKQASIWLTEAISKNPDNINFKLLLANLFLQKEQFDEAIELYTELLSQDPSNTGIHLRIAILHGHMNEYDKAETILLNILAKNNNAYFPRVALARIFRDNDKTKKAVAEYEQALSLNWSKDLAYEIGYLYIELKQFKDALRIYTTITANDPLDEKAALSRIQALLDLKQNSLALEELHTIKLLNGNPEKIDLIISKVLLRQNKVAEATEILKHLTVTSDLSEPHYMLGLLAFQAEEYPECLKHLSFITEESAEFEEAVFLQTRVSQKTGDFDSAITRLKELLANSHTRSPLFYALLSSMYQEKHDQISAIATMEAATTVFSENFQLLFEYGLLLEQNSMPNKALLQMQRVVEIEPDHADALNFIGYTWADNNINLDQALRYILKAFELKPRNGYIVDSLGWVYYRTGELDKAIKWLTLSIELEPEDPHIHDHLGDVYRTRGNRNKAVNSYQKAFELFDDKKKRSRVKKKINELLSQ